MMLWHKLTRILEDGSKEDIWINLHRIDAIREQDGETYLLYFADADTEPYEITVLESPDKILKPAQTRMAVADNTF